MQLFLGAVLIILRLFPKARGHLLFSNYSQNNLPKPNKYLSGQMSYNELLDVNLYGLKVYIANVHILLYV